MTTRPSLPVLLSSEQQVYVEPVAVKLIDFFDMDGFHSDLNARAPGVRPVSARFGRAGGAGVGRLLG